MKVLDFGRAKAMVSLTRTFVVRMIALLGLTALPTAASGQLLYGAESGSNSPLYLIDSTSGRATPIGEIGVGVGGMAFHPMTGVLYGVTAPDDPNTPRNLIQIDTGTGRGTVIGPIGLANADISDIAFNPFDGTLFGWSEKTSDLITINLTTGAGTIVADAGITTVGGGLAFTTLPQGSTHNLAFLMGDGGNGALRLVNTDTGQTTVLVTSSGSPAPGYPIAAMKFRPVTNVLFAIQTTGLPNSGSPSSVLVTINSDGVMTPIGPTVPRLDALAWSPLSPQADLDGDQRADLVLRNVKSGDVAFVPGGDTSLHVISAGVPSAWQIAGVGDVNGDRRADLFWRNTVTGDVGVWLMDGAAVKSTAVIASRVPLQWHIVGVGDLDGDRKVDIIWRNTVTGDVAAWLMDGDSAKASSVIASTVPLAWQIVAIGDFNADRTADLIWRHTQLGHVAAWLMDGTTVRDIPLIAADVPLAWQIIGTGDLDGDGKSDLVWYQQDTHDVAAWLMDGASVLRTPIIATAVPAEWRLVKVQDVNLDGQSDLGWYDARILEFHYWVMNGVTITSGNVTGGYFSSDWQIQ
ncbi:MAG: hypothetical protein DMF89_15715 [Acidobacteria bacterium]|nr:MAG: hypothetical protein DMF89_15715 [Acidobacteriota bacterium]